MASLLVKRSRFPNIFSHDFRQVIWNGVYFSFLFFSKSVFKKKLLITQNIPSEVKNTLLKMFFENFAFGFGQN